MTVSLAQDAMFDPLTHMGEVTQSHQVDRKVQISLVRSLNIYMQIMDHLTVR